MESSKNNFFNHFHSYLSVSLSFKISQCLYLCLFHSLFFLSLFIIFVYLSVYICLSICLALSFYISYTFCLSLSCFFIFNFYCFRSWSGFWAQDRTFGSKLPLGDQDKAHQLKEEAEQTKDSSKVCSVGLITSSYRMSKKSFQVLYGESLFKTD